MTAPDPRLGEIEGRLGKAVKEPWHLAGGDEWIYPIGIGIAPDDGGVTTAEAEFIAAAPADVAYLLAELRKAQDALGRVEGLHQPVYVYEYDDMNGVFRVDNAGEEIEIKTLCSACTGDSVLELIGDCEYDEGDYHDETHWPCPTITAIRAAVAAATGGGE